METLLAHSFDYLSSYEPSKVRKGLRQVEGLLAQICLSKSKCTADRRRSYLATEAQPAPKALAELRDDPAFREFFKLQESFKWNGMPFPGLEFMTQIIIYSNIQCFSLSSSRHAPSILS